MATLRGEVWWGQYLGRKYGHRTGRTVAGALFERQIWPSYGLKYGRRNIWETNMAILRVEVWQGTSWDIYSQSYGFKRQALQLRRNYAMAILRLEPATAKFFVTGKSWGTLWSNFTQTHTQTSGSFQLKYWIENMRESKDGQENPAAFNFWTKEIIVMKIQQPFKKKTQKLLPNTFITCSCIKLRWRWAVIRISPTSEW